MIWYTESMRFSLTTTTATTTTQSVVGEF